MRASAGNTSARQVARIAGFGYLAIIVCGIFAEMFVRSSLFDDANGGLTAQNIMESEGLFRMGIASDLVMLTFDVILGAALYVLVRPFNHGLAVLATMFRVVHAAVYGVTLLTLFLVLELLSGAEWVSGLESGQRNALVQLFAEAQSYGYILALVFFGVHLAILSYMALKYGFLPRLLGIGLAFAATGYLVDSFANVLLSNYADYETLFGAVVFGPAVIAELSLAVWLLVRGIRSGGEDLASGDELEARTASAVA